MLLFSSFRFSDRFLVCLAFLSIHFELSSHWASLFRRLLSAFSCYFRSPRAFSGDSRAPVFSSPFACSFQLPFRSVVCLCILALGAFSLCLQLSFFFFRLSIADLVSLCLPWLLLLMPGLFRFLFSRVIFRVPLISYHIGDSPSVQL